LAEVGVFIMPGQTAASRTPRAVSCSRRCPASARTGVWPGLDERPEIAHTARDWLAKLHLVAAGCGLTTVPAAIETDAPAG
jgi:DNA-binding transcriptional LysR family regulator